ncbi:DUF1385 domain-containing protein [Salinicoccus halodurans]|uniref:Membrane protein n=1 Tax=Salinicoccus halodurans TaxID=407035 RepID=A0A0F7D4D1_9STAP|nr:DUF1385 domain-containing protein [Salinicoccus halodurans]AKG74025.1 membrane protein [Salinicoccus halodurans]SFK59350.1 Uncharacterized conserved protein YqhQ [Salinicoccus halodurans]
MDKPTIGGQAVVEGVMFQTKNRMVTAIRRNNDEIEYFEMERPEKKWVKNLKKVPLLRGNVAILESSIYGMKHLDFATDRYERDPEDDVNIEQEKQAANSTKVVLSTIIVGILSFIIGKFLFTLIPVFIAEVFSGTVTSHFGQVLLESVFKLILLLGYIYVISMTPMVKRLFQYHGAEHKVINTFENDQDLTVENVQRQSRLHYRCGSSFILFTVLVGFVVYMFVPVEPFYVRILNRIALIPVVIGLSFEFLQLTNKLRDIPVLKWLGIPGLLLQYLTTKQPDDTQVEVAVHSFNKLLRRD